MEIWTCFLNPSDKEQLIKNDSTKEEYWVEINEIPNTLFYLFSEKGLKRLWFEGPYSNAYEIINKYRNAYADAEIVFTIN